MSAKCYSCEWGTTPLPIIKGTKGDPIGVCKICHIMACSKHGQRDPGPPHFICVECQPKILFESAASLVQATDQIKAYLIELSGFLPANLYYKSLKDFLERFPDFQEWLEGYEEMRINYELMPDIFRTLFKFENSDVQELLIACAMIIRKLYPKDFPSGYPYYLVQLSNSIDNNEQNPWSPYANRVKI